MPRFRRVRPGQPFEMTAAMYNELIDGLEAQRKGKPLPLAGSGPIEILIQNKTAGALARFAILGVGNVVLTKTENSAAFYQDNVFEGNAPTATATIAILLEPLSVNKIGKAVVVGVTTCKLNVTASGDTHASLTTSTTELTTGTSGPARILWKESGTGAGKWGKVLLAASGLTIARDPVVTASAQTIAASSEYTWTGSSDGIVLDETGYYQITATFNIVRDTGTGSIPVSFSVPGITVGTLSYSSFPLLGNDEIPTTAAAALGRRCLSFSGIVYVAAAPCELNLKITNLSAVDDIYVAPSVIVLKMG